MKDLLTKCGVTDVTTSIDAVIGKINATQEESQQRLQAFVIPTLLRGPSGGASAGAASVTLRTYYEHGQTLISALDQLDWLGLDGRNAWHNWVKNDIEDLIPPNSEKHKKGKPLDSKPT